MTAQSTKTNFLIISDTHNFQFDDVAGTSLPFQLPTPKTDVLLHCGDLTQVGGVSSFKKALKMLGSIEAELKLVIAGNHDLELDGNYWDNQCADEEYPEDREDHDMAVDCMSQNLANDAGVVFLNEGTHTFTLKNATTFKIYVSPYTPAFGGWAFAYRHNEDRFNQPHQVADHTKVCIATNPIPNDIDIVMTHGPPKGILDECPQGHVGCDNLLQAIRRVKPLMHCFGHIHEGYGIEVIDWKQPEAPGQTNEAVQDIFNERPTKNPYPLPYIWAEARGEQTLAVNAAIMTEGNKPENAP